MTRSIIKFLLALGFLCLSNIALAGGGGGKGEMPAPPPPPPAPPMPAQNKAPEPETMKRRNRQAGMEGTNSTILTGNDPTAEEAGLTLGGNTLLGS